MTQVKVKGKVTYADSGMIIVKSKSGTHLALKFQTVHGNLSKFHNGKVIVTIELLKE